ncbi:MAG: hypothetical protein M9949_06160 [Candidatus Kapabacteria bacterium]|nr:hypothetical protein [Candidatus Kapabacteria bacterium]
MELEIVDAVVEYLKTKISPDDACTQEMPEMYNENESEENYLTHPHADIFIYDNGSRGGRRDISSHSNTIAIGFTIYSISERHPRYGAKVLAQKIRKELTVFYPELESGIIESVEWVSTDPLPSIKDGTILLGMIINYNGIYFDGQ